MNTTNLSTRLKSR